MTILDFSGFQLERLSDLSLEVLRDHSALFIPTEKKKSKQSLNTLYNGVWALKKESKRRQILYLYFIEKLAPKQISWQLSVDVS